MQRVRPQITLARRDEARDIAALRVAVAQHLTQLHGEGQWSAIPSRSDVVRQMRASRMLVARLDDILVGTVRLTTINPRSMMSVGFTPVGSVLYLIGLAVAAEYRSMGIGRALIGAAKDMARSARVEALWLDTYQGAAGAGPFYLRCGFRQVSATGTGRVPLVYYEWPVD